MQWDELARFSPERETVLTVGVFDGVHLGHQHLIGCLRRQASAKGLLSGVVTFRCHPQRILSPQASLPYLTSLEERIRLLQELGVEFIIPLFFTPQLAQVSAREFTLQLQKYLRMKSLVIGPDFALGKGREGNASVLQSLGKEMGFTVEVVPFMRVEGEVVSSTAIRDSLAQGDISKARRFLGRTFSLSGQVVHGARRGRFLGFPTANLGVNSNQALPADGVYATRVYIGEELYPSVTNIGRRPTFEEQGRAVEVYLFNFDAELYEQKLRIELLEYLREERQFSSAEELAIQIRRDVEQAKEILEDKKW